MPRRRQLLVHHRQPNRRAPLQPTVVLALAPLRRRRSLPDHLMKKTSALAVLEFADIPAGVWAVDAILKKAPIAFVRAGTVTRGRYLVLFGGSTGSSAESLEEALALCGPAIIDHT